MNNLGKNFFDNCVRVGFKDDETGKTDYGYYIYNKLIATFASRHKHQDMVDEIIRVMTIKDKELQNDVHTNYVDDEGNFPMCLRLKFKEDSGNTKQDYYIYSGIIDKFDYDDVTEFVNEIVEHKKKELELKHTK